MGRDSGTVLEADLLPEDCCCGCRRMPSAAEITWPHCTTCDQPVCYRCRDDLGRCPVCASIEARPEDAARRLIEEGAAYRRREDEER